MNGWRMPFVLVAAALLTACGTVPPSENRDNTQEIQELHAKAQAAYNSNDFMLAQNIYEKIVAQTEVNGETWFMLGNIYATKGEHERALSAYKNALRVNGRDPRVWNNISVIHLKDAWEAAQTVKKLSVKEDPANIQSTNPKIRAGTGPKPTTSLGKW
jgi:Flp pilus assembly protein TadD